MGESTLTWDTTPQVPGATAIPSPTSFPTCTLRTEHLSLHSGTQGRVSYPRSVTVKTANSIAINPSFTAFGSQTGAWFDDGNVYVYPDPGNGQVTIEYVTPTALFPANGAPLPIDRLLFRTN